MPGQNELRFSDASVKEPTRTKPVTDTATTSDSAINLSDGIGAESRKRKRDGSTVEDLLKDSFVVRVSVSNCYIWVHLTDNLKPYPPKGAAKPRTLQPLILLPRSQLPLSSLDIQSSISSNALPKSRLFETHIKILEFEQRMGNQPMVLIARLEDDRTMYAVEREDRGLYVICKLGSWVNISQLRTVAAASRQEVAQAEKGFALSLPQTTVPAIPTTLESSKFSQKKRLAIEAIQSMVKRPSTGLLTDSQSNTAIEASEESQIIAISQGPQESQLPFVENTTSLTSAEIFENIRTQYLDALYLSNVGFHLPQLLVILTLNRHHLHTLPKALCLEREQLSIWITSQVWR